MTELLLRATAYPSSFLSESIAVVSTAVAAAAADKNVSVGFAAAAKEEDAPTTTAAAAASEKLANLSLASAILTTAATENDDVPLLFDIRADPSPAG